MPVMITRVLDAQWFDVLARVLLTLVFWTSGLGKLFDFTASAGIMVDFGLQLGWAYNIATLILQIGASLMIICNRGVWLATGALAVFTVLTIPIAHPFWAKSGEEAFRDMTVALEHISVIGGLAVYAVYYRHSTKTTQDADASRLEKFNHHPSLIKTP
ncbi:DoxX family protein [Pseudochrobactrum asaccharolyticum]|uniref:DoxX family protein n=1 Tax=Pseudochrobactrum asaccharolyticum TaxID=354351 RepID=UPI004041993A